MLTGLAPARFAPSFPERLVGSAVLLVLRNCRDPHTPFPHSWAPWHEFERSGRNKIHPAGPSCAPHASTQHELVAAFVLVTGRVVPETRTPREKSIYECCG